MAQSDRGPLYIGIAIDTIGTFIVVLAFVLQDLEPYRVELIVGGIVAMVVGVLFMLRGRPRR